jgi:hypothetical protein
MRKNEFDSNSCVLVARDIIANQERVMLARINGDAALSYSPQSFAVSFKAAKVEHAAIAAGTLSLLSDVAQKGTPENVFLGQEAHAGMVLACLERKLPVPLVGNAKTFPKPPQRPYIPVSFLMSSQLTF